MYGFAEDEVKVIRKSLMAPGTTEDDLELFLATARKSALDPLSRQIYNTAYKVKDQYGNYTNKVKMTIGTTIDGFRVIAERSDKYAGQLGPFWCGNDGEWKDCWLSKTPPTAAKVGVLRKDFSEPLWAVARFDGYNQGQNQWTRLPEQMIAKCAEMLALRKAFPNLLGGLYGREELGIETFEVEASPAGVQQPTANAQAPSQPPKTAPSSNKESVRQKPAASPAKPEPKESSAPVSSAPADGNVKAGAEDKAVAGSGVASTPAAPGGEVAEATSTDTTAGTEEAKQEAEPPITLDDLMGLLNHGLNHGYDKNEISNWLVENFKVTKSTILELTKNQLAQAKYQFGKRKGASA